MSGFIPNINVLPLSPASVTDASVNPSSVLIDSTVAVPTNIIFQPGVSSSGQGIYKTWAEVMAVVAEVSSPLTINISFIGLGTAVITIPAGIYDMKHSIIAMTEARGFTSVNYLKLAPGAQLKNLDGISGAFTLLSQETTAGFPSLDWDTPPSPYGNLVFFDVKNGAFISSTGSQPIMIADSAKYLLLVRFIDGGLWSDSGSGSFLVHVLHGGLVEFDFNSAGPGFNGAKMVDSVDSVGTLYINGDNSGPTSPAAFTSYTGSVTWLVLDGRASPFANRPRSGNIQTGASILDTTIGRPFWWNGKWNSDQPIISSALSIWISNSLGNDANNGTTSGTPLKTFAEFINRYGISPQVSNVLTITFLDATVAEDIIFTPYLLTGGRVVMDGTPIAAGSGTLTSSPTQRAASTGTCLEVTDTAQTWAPFIGTTLFRHTLTGGEAWCAKDTGTNKCRLSTLTLAPPTGTPFSTEVTTMASGNAYTLWTLPVFTGIVYLSAQGSAQYSSGVEMWVRYIDVRAATTIPTFVGNMAHLHLVSCRMSSPTYSHFLQEDIITSNMCVPIGSAGVSVSSSMASIIFYGGLNLVTAAWAKPLFAIFYLGHLFQGCGLQVAHPAMTILCTDAMVQDWSGGAVLVTNGGLFQVNGGGNNLSGVSTVAGSYIFNVQCGIVTLFVGANWATNVQARGQITATYDFLLNSKSQGSPYVAGSGIAATEVTYTFAHLDAAAGAAGFGGSTSRLDAFASMTKKA